MNNKLLYINKTDKKESLDLYKVVIILLVTFFFSIFFSTILNSSIETMAISGTSMLETLQDNDYVILFKFSSYKRGDIIIFESPATINNPYVTEYLVKRIIALPGDYIEVLRLGDRMVTKVNDVEIDEPYVTKSDTINYREVKRTKLATGEFFYMGDNRIDSYDSRAGNRMGTFSRDVIKGRVLLRYSMTKDENGKTKFDYEVFQRD
ncbi:MAG: signal peptidase I [Christensenellaceae bacterium]|jgi:signal peptidase I|nr:signal peptidase I [Christensenellaceae bacterium]